VKNKIKIFETFAGYGGASFGFKKANIKHEVIGYSEFDKYASEIFELNHPGIKNFGDISKIKSKDIPDFDFFIVVFVTKIGRAQLPQIKFILSIAEFDLQLLLQYKR
jgi:hypothetical protein